MTIWRILSFVVFTIIFVASLFLEQLKYVLPCIVMVASLVGVYEFYKISTKRGCKPNWIIGFVASMLIIIDGYVFNFEKIKYILPLFIILSLFSNLLKARFINSITDISITVFGVLYISLPMALLLNIMVQYELSSYVIIFLVLTTWSTDSGAYVVGKSIGKHKLAPRLSPNKTIEGAIGGLITTIIVAVCLREFWPMMGKIFTITDALTLGVLFGVFGQMGDLCESAFKRDAGVKDSGRTFTGHGGLLDIVDSLIVCIPIMYCYIDNLKLNMLA